MPEVIPPPVDSRTERVVRAVVWLFVTILSVWALWAFSGFVLCLLSTR